MDHKKIALVLALGLMLSALSGCGGQKAEPTPEPSAPPPSSPSYGTAPAAEHAAFGEYGVILGVTENSGSVTIVSEGRYGYHMDEDPAMTVAVTIDETGAITEIKNVENRNQTVGFAEMVTDDYLKDAYAGKAAAPTMEVDAVSGATVTSKAVLYAVQAAANYAQQVYGYVSDTHEEDKAELNAAYPAAYTTVESSADIDQQKIGSVLYAAQGKTSDGREVVAMKVKSAKWLSYGGSANTGWDAAEPSPFTMILVVDKSSNQVIAWQMVKDGTNRPDYFTVPEENINAYQNVAIDSPEAFDDFTEGLVFGLEFEMEKGADGYDVITGTSVVYTGATNNGTFSSQMVRLCFMTAARFYCGLS